MDKVITCKNCKMTFPEDAIDKSQDPKCKCGTRLWPVNALLKETPPLHLTVPALPSEVAITDIVSSMVVFVVKWALAAIPAIIILALVFALISAMAGGTLMGISDTMKHR
jgi:hypothetical protein